MVLQANLASSYGGRNLQTLHPSLNVYPGMQQPVVTPAVREEPWEMVKGLVAGRSPLPDLEPLAGGHNPFEDLYVVLMGIDATNANRHNPNRMITVQVLVNPMVGAIWLGGLLVGFGGLAALLPARRRRRVTAAVPEPLQLQPEEVHA